jgi:hypothetical protein
MAGNSGGFRYRIAIREKSLQEIFIAPTLTHARDLATRANPLTRVAR